MFLAFVATPTSSWSRCRSRHSYCFVDFRQQRSYRFWVAPPPFTDQNHREYLTPSRGFLMVLIVVIVVVRVVMLAKVSTVTFS